MSWSRVFACGKACRSMLYILAGVPQNPDSGGFSGLLPASLALLCPFSTGPSLLSALESGSCWQHVLLLQKDFLLKGVYLIFVGVPFRTRCIFHFNIIEPSMERGALPSSSACHLEE